MLVETFAMEIGRIWDMAESIYYNGFVDFAENEALNRIGSLMSVYRLAASKSTGIVTFAGTIGVNIPLGTIVTTETGLMYQTLASGVIPAGGTIDIAIESMALGSRNNVGSGTITVIANPISGISSVTNAAATTGGLDLETDVSYRIRIKDSIVGLGKGTLEAIIAYVRNVAGVTGVSGTEDLVNHTAHLYVSGAPVSSDVDDAIAESKPAGIFVDWEGVVPSTIDARFDISITATAPADWETRVVDAVTDYIDGLGAGDDVIWSKVMDAIYDAEEVDGVSQGWINDVTNLELQKDSGGWVSTNITIDVDEEAETGTITPTEV